MVIKNKLWIILHDPMQDITLQSFQNVSFIQIILQFVLTNKLLMHTTTSKYLIFDDRKAFQIHGKYVKSLIKIKFVHFIKTYYGILQVLMYYLQSNHTPIKEEVTFHVIIKEEDFENIELKYNCFLSLTLIVVVVQFHH
jgi:hypothetical protein